MILIYSTQNNSCWDQVSQKWEYNTITDILKTDIFQMYGIFLRIKCKSLVLLLINNYIYIYVYNDILEHLSSSIFSN